MSFTEMKGTPANSPRSQAGFLLWFRLVKGRCIAAGGLFHVRVRVSRGASPHAFFTNSDLSPIAPIPSILQSMS
jgi:hypothetical protein